MSYIITGSMLKHLPPVMKAWVLSQHSKPKR